MITIDVKVLDSRWPRTAALRHARRAAVICALPGRSLVLQPGQTHSSRPACRSTSGEAGLARCCCRLGPGPQTRIVLGNLVGLIDSDYQVR